MGIAVASGNVYVTGETADGLTIDLPTTLGAFDETHNGANDAFVSKLIPLNTTTYWNLINPEGESGISAQYATYATLTDMLNDENRTGTFTPGGSAQNIVGSGSDGTNYWNLFNVEGGTPGPAGYIAYATLGDMINNTNPTIFGAPTIGGNGTDLIGTGSDGTIYWNLFNIEGEFTTSAFFATYDNLLDMLADSDRQGTIDSLNVPVRFSSFSMSVSVA